ncbi:MAG: hypothetical protein IPK16_22305 [Anaerolineales bacterium]|nr:hypothetical protein [Anaerolineales bacterium]
MAAKNQPSRKSTNASQPAATKSAPTPAAAPQPVAAKADGAEVWRHDYDYVLRDLRRLLIVSGSLFLIIIILGFFI